MRIREFICRRRARYWSRWMILCAQCEAFVRCAAHLADALPTIDGDHAAADVATEPVDLSSRQRRPGCAAERAGFGAVSDQGRDSRRHELLRTDSLGRGNRAVVSGCRKIFRIRFRAEIFDRTGLHQSIERYFNQIGKIAPKWNRMIFYDGSILHSGDILAPEKLSADPRIGRLTLNGFFTSRRNMV